jgi:hypothetical protein
MSVQLSSGKVITFEVMAASPDDAKDIALQLAKDYELKHHNPDDPN